MEWYSWLAPYLYASFMVLASVILLARGHILLGSLLLVTSATQAIGWEYIFRSDEAPGFTENLSLEYRIISGAVDLSVIAHYMAVCFVVWRFVPRKLNKKLQPTADAPAE